MNNYEKTQKLINGLTDIALDVITLNPGMNQTELGKEMGIEYAGRDEKSHKGHFARVLVSLLHKQGKINVTKKGRNNILTLS